MRARRAPSAVGIPTIWLNFLAWVEANKTKLDLSKLKTVVGRRFGGAARDDREISRPVWRDCAARLGNDRNEPPRHDGRAARQARGRAQANCTDMQVKQGRQVYGIE